MKSFAIGAPTAAAVGPRRREVIVEGAYVGSFDPDYYKSDRKDQKIDELTIVAPTKSETKPLKRQSSRDPSSVRRRTSPAIWSTSRATA